MPFYESLDSSRTYVFDRFRFLSNERAETLATDGYDVNYDSREYLNRNLYAQQPQRKKIKLLDSLENR